MKHRAQRSGVLLVDPQSDLFIRIAGIFRYFEDPQHLTIFQPLNSKGSLSVELKRLALSFYVNTRSLLQCRELRAEIDPNQDAGTLYGFESKIVLRDMDVIERRSIITAQGQLVYKRRGIHVSIWANSIDKYNRFEIDEVLGRLTCPPEPFLLYSKALFHAITSFVLPDPLTDRTGTEEALHILGSGSCQPWIPLGLMPTAVLKALGQLSPERQYYPKDKRRLQTVSWNQNLTTTIQHDNYYTVVLGILAKSDRLLAFTRCADEEIDTDDRIFPHLRKRGQIRRLLYERIGMDPDVRVTGQDMIYEPRDREVGLAQASNVYQITGLFRRQPFEIRMKRDLASILGEWKLIGGFHDAPESIPSCLRDLMESDISEQWGSLMNICRGTGAQAIYGTVFRLCLLSFGTHPDMDILRSLVAFSCLDDLKTLQPPFCPAFSDFKSHSSPTLESLINIIAADCTRFESNVAKSKSKKGATLAWQQDLWEAEGRDLAQFFIKQWPSEEPTVVGFKAVLIDSETAMKRIRPEWQRLCRNMKLSD
ncbi:MAG: hypothetical protein M1818_003509 [Claussenomyces sp. TS43310]|nr:MAG: hypothetical protein M1818_003509 [Claussenomyces sp. TS43310]